MLYLNAQSIVGKIDELASTASDEKPDLILITETWCNSDITDAFLSLPGYSIGVRQDRMDTAAGRGGGILVYVKAGIDFYENNNQVDLHQHSVFKVHDLTIYLVYRSPNAAQDSYDKLSDLIRRAGRNSIIIGDLNLPEVDWIGSGAKGRGGLVQEAAAESLMEQLVDFPTHIRGNILDVILTNIPERFHEVKEDGRLGRSDHCMISATISMTRKKQAKEELRLNWARADWRAMELDLARAGWQRRFQGLGAEEAWMILKQEINKVVEEHVPKYRMRNHDKPAWLNRDILREIRRKKRLWQKAKTGVEVDRYKEAEKRVRNMIRHAKKRYEKKLSEGGNDGKSKRKFFAYIKKKTKTRSTIGPLKNAAGEKVDKDKDMAEVLNEFFASTFTREQADMVPEPVEKNFTSELKNIRFTPYQVKRKIRDLKQFSAPGPDGIGPQLLKRLQDVLAEPLAAVMNKSMIGGEVPADWKTANVTPIFKKGGRDDPGNYRPVSLTSVPCKMMESLIKEKIVAHLEKNGLISRTQHGFMRGRSCTTNLVDFMNKLTAAMDASTPVDVVYLDFAKAFDKVPTRRLLRKLHAHGLRGELLRWITHWLVGRQQRVVLNGEMSAWMDVLSGVPQGSVLGPLLFIIFINDLDEEAEEADLLSKFADDTKVGVYIRSEEDRDRLQSVLNNLVDWAARWGMQFNVAKCKVMHIGARNPQYEYSMNGAVLATTKEEKDLGVIMTDKLSPSVQCAKAAKTANAVLGQISRAFHFRDKQIFTGLYKQYVRPHLEYAVQAWSPWLEKDKEVLEAVQKRAARTVTGLRANDYEERLQELGWTTLLERRQAADMILVNGVLAGRTDINPADWFTPASDSDRSTRSAADKLNLRVTHGRLDTRRNFFTVRAPRSWNPIPPETKGIKKHDQFKHAYASWKKA